MKDVDVLIVGAGLAGLHCAYCLALNGLEVVLVDKKERLDVVHTTGIFVRRTLEDFEIADEYLGPPIKHVSLFSPAYRRQDFDSCHDEFRFARMRQLYESCLQQCQRRGVSWLAGTRYMGSSFGSDGARVQLRSQHTDHEICTRFIVGADGVKSAVAKDLGLSLNRKWIVGVENLLAGNLPAGPPRLFCFLNPRLAPGYICWIAYDGLEAHVGVGGYASRFDPIASLCKFQANVSHIFDLTGATQLERRGGRIPVGGILPRLANKNGLLIGDAAGAASPLTAGGLDPCLRLSRLAAEVIPDFLKSGNPQSLNRYCGRTFRRHFSSRLWARRVLQTIDSPLLIELACLTLSLRPVKALSRNIFFGHGSFPDVRVRSLLPDGYEIVGPL
ncbi:MAG: NAD(P)/FAD-dependent oxidoreductase [Pyrinomonadaceae bacterium]